MKVFRQIEELITLKDAHLKDGRNLLPEDLGKIQKAAVVFNEQEIVWVGEDCNLPSEYQYYETKYLSGYCLTPELVDSHTHIAFGGNRAHEYAMRLNGADYQEIANAGGGIIETMRGTRELNHEQLLELALERCERLYSYGVGTIEVKSGYGLSFDHEEKLSNVIDELQKKLSPRIQILRTYMAAHAIPTEYKDSSLYLDEVVLPLMNKLNNENKIDHIDIFHEQGYFTADDAEKLFNHASLLGLPVKTHADEFNDNKGAILGVTYQALSTDHLLMTGTDGAKALAESATVANFLPGTGLFLGKRLADARKFLDMGVKVGIASDYNPGSCHFDNVLMVAALAAPLFKLNQTELWTSITHNAAHALGLDDQGALIQGMKPRFSFFKCNSVDEITYSWGRNLAERASSF